MARIPSDLLEEIKAVDDDSLPDGAWQAVIEDTVNSYNRRKKTNHDSFSVFMDYIQQEK